MKDAQAPFLSYASQAAPRYVSGHRLAVMAIIAILGTVGTHLIEAGWLFGDLLLISREIAGEEIADPQWALIGVRSVVNDLAVYAFLVAAALFLVWLHRVHQNLASLGSRNLRFSPGWAVGYWFIPILNLFRPFQIMREVWTASDPHSRDTEGVSWKRLSTPARIKWWWGLWLSGWVLTIISGSITEWAPSVEAYWIGLCVLLLAVLLAIAIPGIFLISIIRGIDIRQTEKISGIPVAHTHHGPGPVVAQ